MAAVLGVVAAGILVLAIVASREREFQRLLVRGNAALAADQTFVAIESFSGAIALKNDSMIAFMKRGETYRRRGESEAALRDLRTATLLDPSAVRPAELLGDLTYTLHRFARAAESYQACVRLDDRSSRVFYKLGLALYRSGDAAGAVEALRRAVALDEHLAEAHYLMGVCLQDQGKADEAIASLQHALQLAPGLTAPREELVSIFRSLGREREAIEQLEALAALDPGKPERQTVLALAYARTGRTDLAVGILGRAAERYPDSTGTYLTLGRIWLESAGPRRDRVAVSKAIEALEPLARRPGATSETLALYGRALLLSGDPVRAESTLDQASQLYPLEPSALRDLASVAERLGHIAKARDAWYRWTALAPESDPDLAPAYDRVGELSLRLGDPTTAVQAFRTVLQLRAPSAQAFGRLAEAELAAGDPAGARATVAAGLERDPTAGVLLALRGRLK